MKKVTRPTGSPNNLVDEITHKYVPYWPLLALLMVPCIMLAFVYLKFKAPVYEISATIQVKDEKKGVDEDKITESINVMSSPNIVENEVEVIHSRTFVDQVVKDLGLYAPTFQQGEYRTIPAYLTSPVIIKAEDPDNLVEAKKVFYAYDFNTKMLSVEGKQYPINQFVNTPYGRLMFSPNPNFRESGKGQLYFSLIQPRAVVEGLYAALDVSATSKLSSVVKIKFKDVVQQRGKDIVNGVIEKYNQASVARKTDMAKNNMAFLDQRIAKVVNDLNSVEGRIQRFRSSKGVVNLTDQSRLYLQNVAMNDQKLADLNVQLSVLDQVERYVTTRGTGGIAPATLGVNDPLLSKLLERYYEAEVQYQELKPTTAENNPALVAIATQINTLKPAILDNIRNQRVNVQASLSNLALSNNAYNSVLETIPAKERELLDVSRERTTLHNLYEFLLQKREQTALAYSAAIVDSYVIDRAEASVLPVSPNKAFTYGGALVLAILLTVGYILYRDILTNKVLFRSDIVNNTSYPLLGEVSYLRKGKQMLLTGKDFSNAQDEFRQICLAAGFFSKDNQNKKILVTSTGEGEGKSLVAANIALTLAHAGKQVLVVDADLQQGKLSRTFRALNARGLAEFMQGEANGYGELIKATGYKNVSVIAAGQPTSESSELFFNGSFETLLQLVEEKFDFIIVDAASVNPGAEAYLLSDLCDMTLYIVRHRLTTKSVLKKLDETNELKPLKRLALVFNGVKSRGFILKTSGFGYGNKHVQKKNVWKRFWVKKDGVPQPGLRKMKRA